MKMVRSSDPKPTRRSQVVYALVCLIALLGGPPAAFIALIWLPKVVPAWEAVRTVLVLLIAYSGVILIVYGYRKQKLSSLPVATPELLLFLAICGCSLISYGSFLLMLLSPDCRNISSTQVVCSGFLSRDSLWEIQPNGIFIDHLGEYIGPTPTLAPEIRP
jgi:hypothetical protein